MTQVFNVAIDGTLKTIEKCNISEEMNRFYDVAFFEMEEQPTPNATVVINFGDRTFTGFVYSTSKISKLLYRVECRTEGAKLTEPYSTFTEGFDDAATSHDLCALYALESGIPINITAGNLDFGGSYERKGTMISALSNIANVTGAEFWDDGSGIQIQPNKTIDDNGVEIAPKDIFDFVGSRQSVYNKGVGFVTVRSGGSETSDIISKNSIYAEIDECTGELFVYPNPNGLIEHSTGISPLTHVSIARGETNSLLNQDLIRLEGAIESIESVTLNGANVSDYNFEQGHNVIYFNTLKRGTLVVNYAAYCYKGYTNISDTLIGKFISFDIFYLDQILMFQGFLSGDCLGASTDGDMTCIVPGERLYPKGFDVWTIGGDPEFIFYDKNLQIIRNVVSSSVNPYVSVEDATLEQMESGNYMYRPRYDIGTTLEAKSAGVVVSHTQESDEDGDFFQFTQYYPRLVVSYEVVATNHYIQFADIPQGVITMIIKNNNTDEICEYDLDGIDYDDLDSIPCELDQYINVNIASELGVEVTDVIGKTLQYIKPDTTADSVTADDFGVVKIWVFVDGDYVINTASIKNRTTVTLTANVNG